jgi:hypothetical protein
MEKNLRFKFDFMYIPATMWFENCRYYLLHSSWNEVRRQVYTNDNFICQCCGSKINRPQAHECFKIDGNKFILYDIVTLCSICHKLVHIKTHENMEELKKSVNYLVEEKKILSKRKLNKLLNKYRNIHSKYSIDFKKINVVNLDYVVNFANKYDIKLFKSEETKTSLNSPYSKHLRKYLYTPEYVKKDGAIFTYFRAKK